MNSTVTQIRSIARAAALASLFVVAAMPALAAAPVRGGDIPVPLPLFPATNWWNADITTAPIDANSAAYLAFINGGAPAPMHPDCGGYVDEGPPPSTEIYGIPYIVVDNTQPLVAVDFLYRFESDGVDAFGNGIPFYPIPTETITQAWWIEEGSPGNVDLRNASDRHMLIVNRDTNDLYELYNVWYDTANSQWRAGSGAYFNMDTDNRRPEGWTSADAAGLAILPGLMRWEEANAGTGPIEHALRMTLDFTNGHVYPASHTASTSSNPLALPLGSRLRLKASVNISGYAPQVQRLFQAMKTYGLILADNGSNMYVTGTHDSRWDNGILNPAFDDLDQFDFDVIRLGWRNCPASSPLSGDLDLNTLVDSTDLVTLAGYLVGNVAQGTPPFNAPLTAADVNSSALVDSSDLVILANHLVGNVPCLPV